MRTKTINLAIPKDLLDEVDQLAQEEYRSRSELLREALRRYVIRKQFATVERSIRKQFQAKGLTPADIDRMIAEDRAGR